MNTEWAVIRTLHEYPEFMTNPYDATKFVLLVRMKKPDAHAATIDRTRRKILSHIRKEGVYFPTTGKNMFKDINIYKGEN